MGARQSRTPGGAKLRELREQAGRTQLWVEAEADLGTGYVQRVESGRVAQPGRSTVERILDALGARNNERRAALELFGYVVATPPPTADELAWARDAARRELDAVAFPAYVLDCMNRLVAWNAYLSRLLGAEPGDRLAPSTSAGDPRARRTATFDRVVEGLAGQSMLAPWFDPTSPLGSILLDRDDFLPALIRALRYEMQRFRGEAWYARMLAELLEQVPDFRRYWDRVAREPPSASAARALVPIRLAAPCAGVLQFHLASEPFVQDVRFRIIYYFPADLPTMRQCAAWAGAADVLRDRRRRV